MLDAHPLKQGTESSMNIIDKIMVKSCVFCSFDKGCCKKRVFIGNQVEDALSFDGIHQIISILGINFFFLNKS